MTIAKVILWGRQIGAVEWNAEHNVGVFQYDPQFARSNIQVAPLMMPLATAPYSFPALRESFNALPGLLADSLPDKFGTRLIDAWLSSQGRTPGSMNPVERLCYIGHRGMGALEFEPATGPVKTSNTTLNIEALTKLANQILDEKSGLSGQLGNTDDQSALQDILRVGTSAGGARAKALLAWNPQSGEFRSGQLDALEGFEYWLLKFDGVSNNCDRELKDPTGYGLVEYAYAQMAKAAGIDMMPCRLHHENGRSHFMTRRFDRTDTGKKLHMQSLAALRHFDYNDPASYSYEQALETIRLIAQNTVADMEQQFLRAVFNVATRNQDDHVKNIAFLMTQNGNWRLAPAFDLTYAFNPQGMFTGSHQMSINGKRDGFVADDITALATAADIKVRRMKTLLGQIKDSVERWEEYAGKAGVSAERIAKIRKVFRMELL